MAGSKYFKVVITEHDYEYTTYTAWVGASSRNQAIAKAAALAGQEKTRLQFGRMRRDADLWPCGLLEPDIRLAAVGLEEYWDKQDTVEISGITGGTSQ